MIEARLYYLLVEVEYPFGWRRECCFRMGRDVNDALRSFRLYLGRSVVPVDCKRSL